MKQKLIIFSAFRDKKKYIIYAALVVFIFILCFILCVNYDYYDYQINYVIGKKEINRGLELNYEDNNIKDLVNNIGNIESYFPLYDDVDVNSGRKIYKINSDFQKNIIYGKSIKEKNELLISLLYFRNMELSESDIGQMTITISYDGINYDFKIVGVTDDNHSHFYINDSAMKDFLNQSPNKYYLLVDSYPNVEKVMQFAKNNDYSIKYYDSGNLYEIEEIQKAKKSYVYLYILVLICLTLFFINIIKNIFTSELKNISLYKTIGFKNKIIKKIVMSRASIVLTLSFVITLILTLPVSFIINKSYISTTSTLKEIGLIYLFGVFIIFLLGMATLKRIKRIDITENLKNVK